MGINTLNECVNLTALVSACLVYETVGMSLNRIITRST